jgi:hypothetical protein
MAPLILTVRPSEGILLIACQATFPGVIVVKANDSFFQLGAGAPEFLMRNSKGRLRRSVESELMEVSSGVKKLSILAGNPFSPRVRARPRHLIVRPLTSSGV